MNIKLKNKSMQLIQLSSTHNAIGGGCETPLGLYLVPSTVSIDQFEQQVKCFDKSADPQNDFDELNTIGAIRVEPCNCILNLNNY